MSRLNRGQPMRIVHCFRSPVGGIFRHVRDLVEMQHAAGHLVGMVCDSSTGGKFENSLFAEISPKLALGLNRVPMDREMGIGDIIAAVRVFSALWSMKPDIIHAHSAKGGLYGRILGTGFRIAGRKVGRVYSPHGGSLHYDPESLTGKIIFPIERLLTKITDHVVFVSKFERNTFAAKIGRPRCTSSVVYNGLWERDFEPVASPPGAADFLFIGMMRELKGPDIFIGALAKASKVTGRPLSAVMIGDGDRREEYIAMARQAGLAEQIEFRMPIPAREAFALARTVVVPSRAEALPYIVLEALAAGKSMISTRVGGIPEIFGADSPALINPDPDELESKMIEVLADEEKYAASMPAISALRERFNVGTMSRAITDIYSNTAK